MAAAKKSDKALTPMMQQFFGVKHAHPDAIILFRMGDFFETFYDDAKLAAKLLGITLTARGKAGGEPIPMAGVPAHSVDGYISRLVNLGHKVAICDQVEDPKTAKGIVRREVTHVATPGTTADAATTSAKENVFLAAVVERDGMVGIGFTDLSTGRLDVSETPHEQAAVRIADEIARYQPREILLPAGSPLLELLPADHRATLTERSPDLASPEHAIERLNRHLGVTSLAGFGLEGRPAATAAAGLLFAYLEETQKASLAHVRAVSYVEAEDYLTLDAATVRNLELTRSLLDGSTRATLLEVVDRTRTPMGARLMRERLLRPSMRLATIRERLEAVTALRDDGEARSRLRERGLDRIHDLERLLSRVTLNKANARDLLALRESFQALPRLRESVQALESPPLDALVAGVDEVPELLRLLEVAIADDAPAALHEGGLIKKGYDPKLDELRGIATDGKAWIAAYEAREREVTGINSLKVKFNKVFGYSIEVTRANLGNVPTDRYERRQTLANAERYTTPELKDHEAKVLEAEDRLQDLEYELLCAVLAEVAAEATRISDTARAIAELDVTASLAEVAAHLGWVRPDVTEDGEVEIIDGRHPVVEAGLVSERFVPNDLLLDPDERQILLVTGPNMGGKSTYLRQAALAVVLAQAGSFVPAAKARLPLMDRVFTRVGASDDLARGRSTFMVEMIETANILHNATSRSLVVLDEVGRGTSTFDGLSLAWAIVEHLHEHPRGRPVVLFATHYHELTDLANILPRVANVRVVVRQHEGKIVFVRKIEDGRSDRSYGIEVAKLAGLPPEVVDRAKQVLRDLETVELGLEERLRPGVTGGVPPPAQMTLFVPAGHPVIDQLKRVDTDGMTPLDALTTLADLARRAREGL